MVKLASWEWMFTTIASQLVRGLWKFNLIITMIFQGFIKAVLNFFQSGKSCVNNQWHFFFCNFSGVSKVYQVYQRLHGYLHGFRDLVDVLGLDDGFDVIFEQFGEVVLQFRTTEIGQNISPLWGFLLRWLQKLVNKRANAMIN